MDTSNNVRGGQFVCSNCGNQTFEWGTIGLPRSKFFVPNPRPADDRVSTVIETVFRPNFELRASRRLRCGHLELYAIGPQVQEKRKNE